MADHPRIEELRRRVQRDPASLAFAQLAEECRRAGLHQEAIRVCRTGLAHHPDYLSAHVTLGRALLALGHLDQANAELAGVLRAAPENLAALRGLAEVHHRRGSDAEAVDFYRRALALAPHDVELTEAIEALGRLATAAPVPPAVPQVHPATPAAMLVLPPVPAAATGGHDSSPTSETPVGAVASPARTLVQLERWLVAIDARRGAAPEDPSR